MTFAAPKPGLLLEPGRSLAGEVEVVDIGLDCGRARIWHLDAKDLATRWPRPGPTAHKWQRAVWVIGGSPAMPGAPCLAADGAARGGASYAALSIPGLATAAPPVPVEAVLRPLPATGWGVSVGEQAERIKAIVIGPGLPTDPATGAEILTVARATAEARPELPLVLDGGAIDAIVADPTVLAGRSAPAVLTPHAGELARLLGHRPGPDRLAEGRALAAELGAVLVAKGPTTLAIAPDGEVLVSTAGDQRLATAGTGDVLAGLVGAGLAGGLDPLTAGGLAAELHGGAARAGHAVGFVARDLPPLVADLLTELALDRPAGSAGPGERAKAEGRGMSRSWVEIDLGAVAANVETLLAAASGAELCAVVKANGYGHGAVEVADAAIGAGASVLAVAQVAEGVALREAGFGEPIWVLSEPAPDEFEAAAAVALEPTLYSPAGVMAAARVGGMTVHLKIDTGMGRVGADPGEAVAIARQILSSERLALGSVWTHLACADEPDNPLTSDQLDRYEGVLAELEAARIEVIYRHAANSAGILAHARSHHDIVRAGIALYGLAPGPAVADRAPTSARP